MEEAVHATRELNFEILKVQFLESLVKEYNDYLILGVPTRFFRDWIVSRYLDKILEQVKSFKLSLNRIEFKIIEENKQNQEFIKIDELNKVTEIKDSILN